ncbi:hypothetical protein [Bacillus thuringiensis]|nr:hypothetical protein [Bacillus thuringiensis]
MNTKAFNLTTDDLLILLNSTRSILSEKTKLSLFEQLIQRYHEKRDFNLYEETINAFYISKNAFYLGKTSLHIDISLPKTIKVIDMIAKYESISTDEIPQEHAKYLFALTKEFILVIEKLVDKKAFEGDYSLLSHQVSMLKTILNKSKNNNDIITIFDNVIRNIEESNPLLLEHKEEKKPIKFGELELNSPLYKMSKTAFLGILENLQLYKKDDFYKIVEHALHKYEPRIFHEANQSELPIYITSMKKLTKKMNFHFYAPHRVFENRKKEDLNNMHYYPLPCKTIEEFYMEYCLFLDKLENTGVLGSTEKTYLHYRFLKSSFHLSDTLAQHFVEHSEILLEEITSRLKHKDASKISQIWTTPFTYTELDELIFLDTGRDLRKNSLTYELQLVNGEIIGKWKGKTIRVRGNGYNYVDAPRGDLSVTEYDVIEDIQRSVIKFILPLSNVHLSERMKELISFYSNDILQIELDMINEEEIAALKYSKNINSLIAKILENRLENQMLNDNEIKLIFNNTCCLTNLPFHTLTSPIVISYLKKAVNKKVLDIQKEEDLAKLFIIKMDDKSAQNAFLAEILYEVSPEMTTYLSSLVNEDELESEISLEDRKNELISRYFYKHLKRNGQKIDNLIL